MERALLPQYLMEYLDGLVPPRAEEMQVMEEDAQRTDFPIIGPSAGHFCYQVARMIGARRIFELGSGFGYSTAWFAKAVLENGGGEVFHVVWDAYLSSQAQNHLKELGYGEAVQYHVGEAVQFLKQTAGPFDLIFNDIDKEDYSSSLPIIAEKLRPGGVLLVDNMLWGGRIFDPSDQSPSVTSILKLTELLTSSPEWISTLIPIRDGVMLAYKV
jgi:caffeoyl-CoA O-methyltransferase